MAPTVSVICIFFNAEPFIREAVESVLAQDFEDFELLMVDDGSTDSSSRIAEELRARFPDKIQLLQHAGHANRGMSPSRNLGLKRARGEFVAFIDADDRWRLGKLGEQVAIMRRNRDVAMVCGAVNYWNSWRGAPDRLVQTGDVRDRVSIPPDTMLSLYPLGPANAPCPSDVLLRSLVVERLRGFEEQFRGPLQMYEDQAFFAKLYLSAPVYFSSSVWLDYRVHDDSCVAAVRRAGLYGEVRQFFLDWLAAYVDAHEPADRDMIVGAIERARWELEHPRLGRVLRGGRRLVQRLAGVRAGSASGAHQLARS